MKETHKYIINSTKHQFKFPISFKLNTSNVQIHRKQPTPHAHTNKCTNNQTTFLTGIDESTPNSTNYSAKNSKSEQEIIDDLNSQNDMLTQQITDTKSKINTLQMNIFNGKRSSSTQQSRLLEIQKKKHSMLDRRKKQQQINQLEKSCNSLHNIIEKAYNADYFIKLKNTSMHLDKQIAFSRKRIDCISKQEDRSYSPMFNNYNSNADMSMLNDVVGQHSQLAQKISMMGDKSLINNQKLACARNIYENLLNKGKAYCEREPSPEQYQIEELQETKAKLARDIKNIQCKIGISTNDSQHSVSHLTSIIDALKRKLFLIDKKYQLLQTNFFELSYLNDD